MDKLKPSIRNLYKCIYVLLILPLIAGGACKPEDRGSPVTTGYVSEPENNTTDKRLSPPPLHFTPTPVWPPPDSAIGKFIAAANLSSPRGADLIYSDSTRNLTIFQVTYNFTRQDMGDFSGYWHKLGGIQYGDKIGWLAETTDLGPGMLPTRQNIPSQYFFSLSDQYLFSDAMFNTLNSTDYRFFEFSYLPALGQEPAIPNDALLRISMWLYQLNNKPLAFALLGNPTVQKDSEILTVLAKLPVFINSWELDSEIYSVPRAIAQSLLASLAGPNPKLSPFLNRLILITDPKEAQSFALKNGVNVHYAEFNGHEVIFIKIKFSLSSNLTGYEPFFAVRPWAVNVTGNYPYFAADLLVTTITAVSNEKIFSYLEEIK